MVRNGLAIVCFRLSVRPNSLILLHLCLGGMTCFQTQWSSQDMLHQNTLSDEMSLLYCFVGVWVAEACEKDGG